MAVGERDDSMGVGRVLLGGEWLVSRFSYWLSNRTPGCAILLLCSAHSFAES